MVHVLDLHSDQDWEEFRNNIDPKRCTAFLSVIQHVKAHGAIGVIIEDEYLDRDYSADFSSFYSKLFKPHSKICRRLHFFSQPVSSLAQVMEALAKSQAVENLGISGHYLGFCVIRPIPHAPVGRTMLVTPDSDAPFYREVSVRARNQAHLLGSTLETMAAPFIQQDTRVGACAQATIWMASRHFHTRHRAPFISMPDITAAATAPRDQYESQSIPAGSAYLSLNGMVRALRASGREPLVYAATMPQPNQQSSKRFLWSSGCEPQNIISRYVDSGIPVIVGLAGQTNADIGHAVLAIGRSRQLLSALKLPDDPTWADFTDHFIVHDDQRGPYFQLYPKKGIAPASNEYSLEDVWFLIVPLPEKVYFPAEIAEEVSRHLLRSYVDIWPTIRSKPNMGSSTALGDGFVEEINGRRAVARTYLTYGWRYKQRLVRNHCSPVIKHLVLNQDFPRFVWVTEFGTLTSMNAADEQVQIFGHGVLDATSNGLMEPTCFFHAPGFAVTRKHDGNAPTAPPEAKIYIVSDDKPYSMKIRGRP